METYADVRRREALDPGDFLERAAVEINFANDPGVGRSDIREGEVHALALCLDHPLVFGLQGTHLKGKALQRTFIGFDTPHMVDGRIGKHAVKPRREPLWIAHGTRPRERPHKCDLKDVVCSLTVTEHSRGNRYPPRPILHDTGKIARDLSRPHWFDRKRISAI